MQNLLPVVKSDIVGSVQKYFEETTIDEALNHIRKNNPLIANLIDNCAFDIVTTISEAYGSPEEIPEELKEIFISTVCVCKIVGGMVYKVLESQVEADRMNEEFA